LFDFVFLFDFWFQEFQIELRLTLGLSSIFSLLALKIRFACQDGKAAPLLEAAKNAGIFREYDTLHTAEYATAF